MQWGLLPLVLDRLNELSKTSDPRFLVDAGCPVAIGLLVSIAHTTYHSSKGQATTEVHEGSGVLHDDEEEAAIRNLALFIECPGGDQLLDLNLKLVVDVLVQTNGRSVRSRST